MRRFYRSLRWQVQAWHGALLLLVLVAFGTMTYWINRDAVFRRTDAQLQRMAQAVTFRHNLRPSPPGVGPGPGPRRGPGPEGPGGFPPEAPRPRPAPPFAPLEQSQFEYVIYDPAGVVVAQSENAPGTVPGLEDWIRSKRHYRLREGRRELLRLHRRGHVVWVARSMEGELAALQRLAWSLVLAGSGVLFLGLAGGWWLSARAIRPIRNISQAAEHIAEGNLSERVSVSDTESELGQLAQVLNRTFDRLEAAFARQAQFTTDASHELRTPVSVILTQAQSALRHERTTEEYREALASCQRAAQRMRSLIESMLVLARQDTTASVPGTERFDLGRVAGDALELLRPLADEKGLRLTVRLQPATACGSSEQMNLVATNLLSNAIHYNQAEGEVEVTTSAGPEGARLTVRDTGPGIAGEDLPRIFDRFYRADASRSRAEGRTGLGLAICKSIVEAHGGRITVQSRPGEGATFQLILPPA